MAAYFGETTARIFVAANGPIKTAKDLNGKRIGVISATHTSYRTVLYINQKVGITAEPVSIGTLSDNIEALKAGQIDALYSAEGAALTLIDSGDLRLVLPLADIYTAVVIWATDDLIEKNPDLVGKFVNATLEIVGYLKANPGYASQLYVQRTKAAMEVAEKAVASLNRIFAPSGRGSGKDLRRPSQETGGYRRLGSCSRQLLRQDRRRGGDKVLASSIKCRDRIPLDDKLM